MRILLAVAFTLATVSQALAADLKVAAIKATHRDGQTFVTWRDVAAGEAGAAYRYSIYRSPQPITAANLSDATLCMSGVLNNSAKLYGSAFNMKDRLDPTKPYATLANGGQPLPAWSGLAVVTTSEPRKAYYAVIATDTSSAPASEVIPGESATTAAVEEQPAPIQAIKLYDSHERTGPYVKNTALSGKKGLPLHVTLHGSNGAGGGAGAYGDYFLYFGTPQMGYRDGLAGVFSIEEMKSPSNRLLLRARDAVEHPSGARAMETYWFGYACKPQLAAHDDVRFYPYTENQLAWIVAWAVKYYEADPNRVTMGGSSSGGVGSFNVGMHHPELFSAVYPTTARVRKVPAISLDRQLAKGASVLMDDGKTDYADRANGPKFVSEHTRDLPFVGWAVGRRDYAATWQEQIDMVRAMTAAKHGFAFSWNNGDHSGGGAASQQIQKWYPSEVFARNLSYPALGNSSINQNMGGGDPADGDLEGGINLGFRWKDVVDESGRWSVSLANELAKDAMTVDVTPRRCQQFKPRPGDAIRWANSTGDTGTAVADAHGLVTIERLKILPGTPTVLTLSK